MSSPAHGASTASQVASAPDWRARWFPLLTQLVRGRSVDRGTVRLERRRVYILPTRHGVLFAAFLLAMLLGSINYGLSLGFVLTFLLAGLALVGMLHTYRNLLGLRIASRGAAAVFAGDDAVLEFEFGADQPRRALQLRTATGAAARFDLTEIAGERVGLAVPTRARGWLKPGRITVFTTYPLGLYRAWGYVQFDTSVLVYPTAHGSLPMPPATPSPQSGEAGHTDEGAEDFAGLRDYRLGDAPRRVAWKALGKSATLLTKRFEAPAAAQRWFDWRALPNLDVEARLSQLAAWVVDAERSGLPYGLRLPQLEIAPACGAVHRHTCLMALALYGTAER